MLAAATWGGEDGRMPIVRTLLERKVNIHQKSNSGRTAILTASFVKRLDLVRLLHENGADIDAADHFDTTPLMYAAVGGHRDLLRWLISHRANVHAVNKRKRTCLEICRNKQTVLFMHQLLEEEREKYRIAIGTAATSLDRSDVLTITIWFLL